MRLVILGLLVLTACGPRTAVPPECDVNSAFMSSMLTCDAAVAAALEALPPDHLTIKRIQFLYGSPVPITRAPVRRGEPIHGYVVFTFVGGVPQQYVPVHWLDGNLTTEAPADY
jgi:hypothetical protein